MLVKIKNDSLQTLNAKELQQINGGVSRTRSITMSSNDGSILSMDFEWHQGNMSKSFKIEAGKKIDLNIGAFGHC